MYNYLKEKFPDIIEPKIDGKIYRWKVSCGGVRFCLINVRLEHIRNGRWDIVVVKKFINDGYPEEDMNFIYQCSLDDDLGKLILDKVGEWLSNFSHYKRYNDRQLKDREILQVNYRIVYGNM